MSEAQDARLLDALNVMVGSAGWGCDVVIQYDEEDGYWLTEVERGRYVGEAMEPVTDMVRLPDLRSAIYAAVKWHNDEALRPHGWRKRINLDLPGVSSAIGERERELESALRWNLYAPDTPNGLRHGAGCPESTHPGAGCSCGYDLLVTDGSE
jgi:hypothetical protein